MIRFNTRIGLMAGPPNMPECRSLDGPLITTSSPNRPRSMVQIAGVSLSNMPVSQISAISAVSSSRFSSMKGISEGEPDSSSPSRKMVIFPGSSPVTTFHARHASIKVINCPLSSLDPRARITLPFGVSCTSGSNGSRSHRSRGSTG